MNSNNNDGWVVLKEQVAGKPIAVLKVHKHGLIDVYCVGNHNLTQRDHAIQLEMGYKLVEVFIKQDGIGQIPAEPVAYIEHSACPSIGDNLVWDNPGGSYSELFKHSRPSAITAIRSVVDKVLRHHKIVDGVIAADLAYGILDQFDDQSKDATALNAARQEIEQLTKQLNKTRELLKSNKINYQPSSMSMGDTGLG